MKSKILTTIAVIALLFTSCSSDDNNNDNGIGNIEPYYIRAKVNGQLINVSNLAQALQQGSGNNRSLRLYASKAIAPNIYPFLSCDISNLTQITTGTYSATSNNMLFQYFESSAVNYGDYIFDTNGNNAFSLTITELTPSIARGTFQGQLQTAGTTNTVTVTEGEFLLPRYYNEYGNTTPN